MEELNLHLEELKNEFKSYQAIINWQVKFGKHKGKTYLNLFSTEQSYVKWMVDAKMMHEKVLKCYELYSEINNCENKIEAKAKYEEYCRIEKEYLD